MTHTSLIPLRPRLLAIAEMIPQNSALVLDIGTDHAQLPVYLVQSGIASRAIASDIAKEPLKRAEETVTKYGLQSRIALHLGDGLQGHEQTKPDAIVIAGMGGEMIQHILASAPLVKELQCRLILQPMTRSEVLRAWLGQNGFTIDAEKLVQDDKLYQIIACHYTGESCDPTQAQCVIGPCLMQGGDPLLAAHLDRLYEVYEVRLNGKEKGDCDTSAEREILSAIQSLRRELTT